MPVDPISSKEKRLILLRLNQVIEHRLINASSNALPLQMRNLTIENGRVTFTVPHEFEVSLTVMGDGPNIPWRLLKVNVLVEDKETGEGKALIHSMQVGYVERLCQARLLEHANAKPLHDLYQTLHSLCQSLQLEVLHAQTQKLIFERLSDYVRVEEYVPGRCLTVSYWRELLVSSELGYRLSVQVDPAEPNRPLSVVHVPPLEDIDGSNSGESLLANFSCTNLEIMKCLESTIGSLMRSPLKSLVLMISLVITMDLMLNVVHRNHEISLYPRSTHFVLYSKVSI